MKNKQFLTLLFFTVTERCRSKTAGHIDVGGNIRLENSPSIHSAFTDAAHRLWSYRYGIWYEKLMRKRVGNKNTDWNLINLIDIEHIFYTESNVALELGGTYHNVTPTARQTGYAVIRFNAFPAFRATAIAIAFDPMVQQLAVGTFGTS